MSGDFVIHGGDLKAQFFIFSPGVLVSLVYFWNAQLIFILAISLTPQYN